MTASTASLVTVTPAQAQSFVNSVGVDTHFNFSQEPYVTAFATIEGELASSGILHIRDGDAAGSDYGNRLTNLASLGITHSIGFSISATAAQIEAALAAQEPYVDFVETANEYDTNASSDPSWASELETAQETLYNAVRSNSANVAVAVLGPSMANPADYADLSNLTSYADFGNLHDYACNQDPGTTSGYSISTTAAEEQKAVNQPIATTETGYNDASGVECALSDAVIAKYIPRTAALRFNAGQPRTYFYQFADEPDDPSYGGTGLVTSSGSPKPQYDALQSMLALISDPGASFSPTPLSCRLSGNTQNVQYTLLQKRSGEYIAMLWLEVPGWSAPANNIGGSAVTVSPQTVTLSIAKPDSNAALYTYNANWGLTKTALSSTATTFSLSVTDSIEFVTL